MTGGNIGSHQRVDSGEARGCLGRNLRAVLPPDSSWTRRGGSGGAAARHLAPAGELGGEVRAAVSVRLHQGCLPTDVHRCVCAAARLRREDVSIGGWRPSDFDLEAAACQSPPPEARRDAKRGPCLVTNGQKRHKRKTLGLLKWLLRKSSRILRSPDRSSTLGPENVFYSSARDLFPSVRCFLTSRGQDARTRGSSVSITRISAINKRLICQFYGTNLTACR